MQSDGTLCYLHIEWCWISRQGTELQKFCVVTLKDLCNTINKRLPDKIWRHRHFSYSFFLIFIFRAFIQGTVQTFLAKEIVRLTLFSNFLIHNYIHYIHYTFFHILPIMCWFWRGSKTGVLGEKPSKHRRHSTHTSNKALQIALVWA